MKVDFTRNKLNIIKTIPVEHPIALSTYDKGRRSKFLVQSPRGEVVYFTKTSADSSDETIVNCHLLMRDSLEEEE